MNMIQTTLRGPVHTAKVEQKSVQEEEQHMFIAVEDALRVNGKVSTTISMCVTSTYLDDLDG